MKPKFTLIVLLLFSCYCSFSQSQYIGVKARYADTRLVDNSPLPPSRENRLILSFFEVNLGVYTPAVLSNYDIWIYKEGLQYGSDIGDVLDSAGNNYPGYGWTAPRTLAYFNSYALSWIGCDPDLTTQYTVNGHELDCGFIRVSHWEEDPNYGYLREIFTAPNVCLPYFPGNLNFGWPIQPIPTNYYSYSCFGLQQLVVRGVLPHDSSQFILPVKFDNVKVAVNASGIAIIDWSNMTESDIGHYDVEKSVDGNLFHKMGTVLPKLNNYSRADYAFTDSSIGNSKRIFYRIKACERNGTYLYSRIVIVTRVNMSNTVLVVYPNPASNSNFRFQCSGLDNGAYRLMLMNNKGQEIMQRQINHTGGTLSQSVELKNMPPGLYVLILQSPRITLTQKIVIVR